MSIEMERFPPPAKQAGLTDGNGGPVEFDTVIVGAGVVGMSIAHGLAGHGERLCVVDEGDTAFRAARGNFGLVWIQGKGAANADYARWSMDAAAMWPGFAAALLDATSVDVELSQPGGLTICVDDAELRRRAGALQRLREKFGAAYRYAVLTPHETRALIPAACGDIAGSVMCALDGHLSPMKLLRALFTGHALAKGAWLTGESVTRIEPRGSGGFLVHAGSRQVGARKIVLAAGLGNARLAPMLGLRAPVRPVRGQLLITERLRPFLHYPTLHVRQTAEGTVQIGDSKEEVGLDDGTTLPALSRIAARAVRCFPCLAGTNVVRTWGALRVMSPDGYPIYQASSQYKGAFLVTCHSGITLAPQHAGPVASWIRGRTMPAAIAHFGTERFHVQAH